MEIQNSVEQELYKIHRTRNRIGYLPALLAFGVSCYFQSELVEDARWISAFGLIVFGTILRILSGELFFEQWRKKVPWARGLNLLCFFLIALGLVLHFADVFFHYGSNSRNTFYTLVIISAFVTGSSTSLVADRPSYIVYVGTLAVGVVVTYFLGAELADSYIILNIFIFLFFSVGTHKVAHKQLCDLLYSEIYSRHEKERLSSTINAVPGFVGLIDRNHVCYMANQATLTLYPDIIGRKIGNLDPHSSWERFVIDFMSTDKQSDVVEAHTVFNGQDIYALVNVVKYTDGGVAVVSIITNELVEARKKIREQEAKAHYSAKLASLGEMAAGIAHEVNNPLTIIQGSANIIGRLVEQEPLDKETLKMMTGKITVTCERISKTVRSLKALSRNSEGDPKVPVAVKRFVDICTDVCEQRFKSNDVKLITSDIPNGYTTKGREVQLSQVLLNLLNNSVDAVKKLDERWVKIEVEKTENWIDIKIIDSGRGIPKEIQDKIMDPFFTTKDVNEGTGLGLSISKSIVQDNGGDLTLLPQEPNTTFRIRLPVLR